MNLRWCLMVFIGNSWGGPIINRVGEFLQGRIVHRAGQVRFRSLLLCIGHF